MRVEIIRNEDLAAIKKVDIVGPGNERTFLSPAPVYVPFLAEPSPDPLKVGGGISPDPGSGDERNGREGDLLSFFPVMNTMVNPDPGNTDGCRLYLTKKNKVRGGAVNRRSVKDGSQVNYGEVLNERDGLGDDLLLFPGFTEEEPRRNFIYYTGDGPNRDHSRDNPDDPGDEGRVKGEHIDDERAGGTDEFRNGVIGIRELSHFIRRPRRFLELLRSMRAIHQEDNLFYAPGVADPFNLSLLAYLGFDLFDTVKAARDASKLNYWTAAGPTSLERMNPEYFDLCNCSGCGKLKTFATRKALDANDLTDFDLPLAEKVVRGIYYHNCLQLSRMSHEVRGAIDTGQLYKHAHSHSYKSWTAATILRLFYSDMKEELIGTAPRRSERELLVGGCDMLRHPDIVAFCDRLRDTYVPPERTILLLLPCSYVKPYSNSRTHRIIGRVVRSHSLRNEIHSVVVTSPLGIVPMELENTYPAKNYDIPVTGRWTEVERKRVAELAEDLIEKGDYKYAVACLGPENYLVEGTLREHFSRYFVINGEVRSEDSLKELESCLDKIGKLIKEETEGEMEGETEDEKMEDEKEGETEGETEGEKMGDEKEGETEGEKMEDEKEGETEGEKMEDEKEGEKEREEKEEKNGAGTDFRDEGERGRNDTPVRKDVLWGVLTFQFDEDIADRLCAGSHMKGRYPFRGLFDNETKDQIARYVPKRGLFSLSKGSAPRLKGLDRYRVFIHDFHPKGTVFCVGIEDADENIRPKDEVLVCHKEELRALGRALTSGRSMISRGGGKGVKIRHLLTG